MTIVQEARKYINCMKATDSTSQHHQLIVGLLLEIKCLKIQVCDRGNSFQKAAEENKNMKAALVRIKGKMPSIDDTPDTQSRMWEIDRIVKETLAE